LLPPDQNPRSNYGAGLLHFTQFCDSLSVPESHRMLASAILLSAFAASGLAKVSRSCVDSWMAGLRFWHTFNGATWNGEGNEMLAKVKGGISHMTSASSKRPKRPP